MSITTKQMRRIRAVAYGFLAIAALLAAPSMVSGQVDASRLSAEECRAYSDFAAATLVKYKGKVSADYARSVGAFIESGCSSTREIRLVEGYADAQAHGEIRTLFHARRLCKANPKQKGCE